MSKSPPRLGCLILIGLFAAFGALVALGVLVRSLPLFYDDEISRQVSSPDNRLVAYQKVTRGGLGTVWTTRLFVGTADGSDELQVYKNGDSGFEPPFRWEGPETLRLFLPCGRIDYLGNPADWASGDQPIERVKVRWTYLDADCRSGAPHTDNESGKVD